MAKRPADTKPEPVKPAKPASGTRIGLDSISPFTSPGMSHDDLCLALNIAVKPDPIVDYRKRQTNEHD